MTSVDPRTRWCVECASSTAPFTGMTRLDARDVLAVRRVRDVLHVRDMLDVHVELRDVGLVRNMGSVRGAHPVEITIALA